MDATYFQLDDIASLLAGIDDKLKQLLVLNMDNKIKKLQKDTKKIEKQEGSLLKADKKRDQLVDAGKAAMKKKC